MGKVIDMRISMIRRLRITYAFWRALGHKNRNTVLAVVHECGFADITAGHLSDKTAKVMRNEMKATRYDYEHKTT